MIALAVRIKSATREFTDVRKHFRCRARDHSQRFQVTRAGRFQMQQLATDASNDRIDGKLVRAAVDADFVWAAEPGHRHVLGQLLLELLEVTTVVDPFFEFPDEARRKTYHVRDLAPLKFQSDEKMVEGTGNGIRFIDRDFDLK